MYNSEKHIFQANDIGLIKLKEMAPYTGKYFSIQISCK